MANYYYLETCPSAYEHIMHVSKIHNVELRHEYVDDTSQSFIAKSTLSPAKLRKIFKHCSVTKIKDIHTKQYGFWLTVVELFADNADELIEIRDKEHKKIWKKYLTHIKRCRAKDKLFCKYKRKLFNEASKAQEKWCAQG